jgi:GNAT superfamily N-acetyltransferase
MTATPTEHVVLSDGRDAVLRPLAPMDRDGLEELFGHTSPDNLYTRFFGIGADTVTKHLDHLFAGDSMVSTYVLMLGKRVLGVADVEHLDATSAEVAFLVADDTHGCGVATLLLERAAADARNAGIEWFVADVLAVNHLMLQVFADIGFPVVTHREGFDVSLRMSTELNPAARDAATERVIEALAHRKRPQNPDTKDNHTP